MKPEEYQQVKRIFQTAIEMKPEKREVFLDSVCQDNKQLRVEVERLLNAEDSQFMEEPVMAQMADVIVREEVENNLIDYSGEYEKIDRSGRYKIISKIGIGGMGEVFLAEDTKLKRRVAIKFLNQGFTQQTDLLDRFFQEGRSASALNHPNIITIFEIKKRGTIQYIISEYIEGETLSEKIANNKLPILTAIDIAIQIASALTATHEAGIIHRDIKPDNIMIRNDGIVKVLDFGLAKPIFQNNTISKNDAETIEKVVTVPGMIMGTPQYMSPEQARGRKIDARTDIFSFGILFYEMLTGKLPFEGENPIDVIGSILKDEPKQLGEYVKDISPELEFIINKALRKETDERYQHISELLSDLEDLRDELKFEAKLSNATFANIQNNKVQSIKNTKRRRFSFTYALLFLFSISFIVIVFWWITTGANNKPTLPENSSLTVTEITNWSSAPGELFSTGAFSPNGNMIAFGSTRSGINSIWIKQTSSGEAVQITKDDFENKYPVWSSNGEEIAYISFREGKSGIWRIPSLGGSPNLITMLNDAGTQLRYWSKTGNIYFESNRNLFILEIETGKIKHLTDFDSKSTKLSYITISPDEKNIAYIASEENKWKIFVTPINDKFSQPLIIKDTEINTLVWHPDGNSILFSNLLNGIFQIFTIDIKSKQPTQISFANNDSLIQDISLDGKQILFSSVKESSNLWNVELATNKENLFTSDIASEMWADVSPDEQKVVFQSIKNLSQGNKLLNGSIIASTISMEDRSLELAENGFLPKWSPDGKTIAYLRVQEKKAEIWVVKDSGGESKRITNGGIDIIGFTLSPYNRLETKYYDWSPNSNEVAYISDRNGASNIWLVAADGSKDTQLTKSTDENLLLYSPIWSDDGKKIAYSTQSKTLNREGRKNRKFWVFDRETEQVSKIFETNETVRLIGWSENGDKLIYALTKKNSSMPPEVFLYDISIITGDKTLINTLSNTYYYNIFLSSDRKKIAYVSRPENIDDIWLVSSSGGKPEKLTNNNDPRLYFSSLSWSPDGKKIFFGKQSRFSLLSVITNFE